MREMKGERERERESRKSMLAADDDDIKIIISYAWFLFPSRNFDKELLCLSIYLAEKMSPKFN